MANPLDPIWREEVDKLHGSSPFVWFLDVPLHYDASLVLVARLTSYPEKIVVDGARTYYPWPMSISPIEQQQDGDLPQARLELGNPGRLLAPYFEDPGDARGIMGKRATVTLRNLADLTVAWTYSWRINGATMDRETCVIALESPNWFSRLVPQDRFNVRACRWRFAGPECGYTINVAAAYTSCPKTFAACVVRGLDLRGRNLAQILPGRFGGFLGILAQ